MQKWRTKYHFSESEWSGNQKSVRMKKLRYFIQSSGGSKNRNNKPKAVAARTTATQYPVVPALISKDTATTAKTVEITGFVEKALRCAFGDEKRVVKYVGI